MSRRIKRKLNRAAYPGMGNPGGATMYISPGQLQSLFAQTFYGSKAGIPVQDATMFSPGTPLPTQPGVNKGGLPNQFKFPIAYNTYNPDRTLGKPDIPSFQQLRQVAMLYSGVTLCERAWFDMVPRMQLKINLHPDYVAQGYEEKDFQQEISYFRKWFEKPDGRRDIHTWLRMALREQTQIDELYLYKHRTKGGKLLGLHVVAGDTMKPLLNDWGDIPLPDDPEPYAYQQYPWGIPGAMYTTDMMVHYQESPAADTPYGQSRVERIIMEVNQALRKKRRDLAMFTEGNIPQGLMEVPEAPQWTPDIIDAYEQSWNALIAGNPQQQVRVKFTQPGMKYVKTDSGEIMTDFDLFLLNIATGCYGMSLQDLSFTGDIHKSSGDSQQNVLYRRTIGPLAMVYGMILTDVMHTDFEPQYKGNMFIVTFGGFEEAEDLGAMATAYSALTSAGILGLTNAGKLMKLPEDPNAPHIGRIIITKDGPIFLDDMASDKMRNAAMQAKMAGYAMATNPPETAQNDKGDTTNAFRPSGSTGNSKTRGGASSAGSARGTDTSAQGKQERALCVADERGGDCPDRMRIQWQEGTDSAQSAHSDDWAESGEEPEKASGAFVDVQRPQQNTETEESPDRAIGGEPGPDASREAQPDPLPHAATGLYPDQGQAAATKADYKRWRTRAIEDVKAGRLQRSFTSTVIPASMHDYISQLLRVCRTADEVRGVFSRAQLQESEIAGSDQHLVYNEHFQVWEPHDTEQQLERMRAEGVQYLEWETHISNSGVCPLCDQNVGQVVAVGTPFKSGHRLPSCHPGCQCGVKRLMEKPIERAVEPVSYVSKKGTCDCEQCRAMDGKVIGEKKPPFHDGCDCSVKEE